MHISHVHIDGFKRLMHFDLTLSEKFNVIVGDNETGRTSVLEAINLVLTRQYDSGVCSGLPIHLFYSRCQVFQTFIERWRCSWASPGTP